MKPTAIYLEGPDGLGKSTAAELLAQKLNAKLVRQPSGDNWVGYLRREVKENSAAYEPFGVQCLHTISHVVDAFTEIGDNINVVFDRSFISTFVYGKTLGLTDEQNKLLLHVHKSVYRRIFAEWNIFYFFFDGASSFRSTPDDEFEKTVNWKNLRQNYHTFMSQHTLGSNSLLHTNERSHTVLPRAIGGPEEVVNFMLGIINEGV